MAKFREIFLFCCCCCLVLASILNTSEVHHLIGMKKNCAECSAEKEGNGGLKGNRD